MEFLKINENAGNVNGLQRKFVPVENSMLKESVKELKKRLENDEKKAAGPADEFHSTPSTTSTAASSKEEHITPSIPTSSPDTTESMPSSSTTPTISTTASSKGE